MKNVLAEKQVKDYFCNLKLIEAKKTLFALTNLGMNERLNDSCIKQASYIAEQFDGVIIANYARELAVKLAEEYVKYYPASIMTKKDTKKYTDVNYIKLLNAFGVYGFDYIIEVIQNGKANVKKSDSSIDEERLLQALRWDEKREDVDVESSNKYHHETGLRLLGFEETASMLEKYSYTIANIYEQLAASFTEIKENKLSNVRRMKINFIQNASIIESFYNTVKPEIPEGYSEMDFEGATIVYNLAEKGMLKDSDKVLEYYDKRAKYENALARLNEEFSSEEIKAINNNKEIILELIKDNW